MTLFEALKLQRRNRACRWLFSASLLGFTTTGAIADGNVQLTWEPNTDPDVIGYNIYYGPSSRTYTYAVPLGLVTNATVSGLREGATYYFALVTCTSGGSQSAFSDEVSQFIPVTNKSAFAAVSGTYNGLFFEADQIPQPSGGLFSLFVNGRGAYSGRIQSGGIRASFHGQLDPWCQATNVLAGPNNHLLQIQFRLGGNAQPGHLIGEISQGITASALTADRSSFNARTFPAPFAGRYTCVLPGEGTDGSAPQGYGFGVAQVAASGLATWVGTLADGTHISQSAPISDGGVWPFYAPLYSGKGSLIGFLMFTNDVNDDLKGMVNWIKPSLPNVRYYSAGFTNQSQMIGSNYRIPSPITEPVLDLPIAFIAFSGGNLGPGFTNAISVGGSSRVTNRSPNGLGMMFSISTGTFRGNVVDPISSRALPFSGVVFQKDAAGYGLLLGTDQVSSVLLGY